MKKIPTKDSVVQTGLRLPKSLHKSVKDAADKNGRSLNAEIVSQLASFPDISEQLASINQQLLDLKQLVKDALNRE